MLDKFNLIYEQILKDINDYNEIDTTKGFKDINTKIVPTPKKNFKLAADPDTSYEDFEKLLNDIDSDDARKIYNILSKNKSLPSDLLNILCNEIFSIEPDNDPNDELVFDALYNATIHPHFTKEVAQTIFNALEEPFSDSSEEDVAPFIKIYISLMNNSKTPKYIVKMVKEAINGKTNN